MRHNQKGFVLLQAIMSLTVLCTVALLLCQMMVLTNHLHKVRTANEMDVDIATLQLETELLSGSSVQATGSVLTFNSDGHTVRYSKSGDRLIRQVDSSGYEIVLLTLQSVLFEKKDKLIKMTLVNAKGRTQTWDFICGIDFPLQMVLFSL